jgi:hypothetical protein
MLGSLFWVLMPLAIALGGNYTQGIGVYFFNSKTPLVVTTDMLAWLWPLSDVTTAAGVLLFFGRGYRFGLAVSALWVAIGAVTDPRLLVAMSVIALCVFTGRHSFVAAPPGETQRAA